MLGDFYADLAGYVLRTLAIASWLGLNVKAYVTLPPWIWIPLILVQALAFLWWLAWAVDPHVCGEDESDEDLTREYEQSQRTSEYEDQIEDEGGWIIATKTDQSNRTAQILDRLEELVDKIEVDSKAASSTDQRPTRTRARRTKRPEGRQ